MRVLLTGVRRIDELSVRASMGLETLKERLPLSVLRMPYRARESLDAARRIVARRSPLWLKGIIEKG